MEFPNLNFALDALCSDKRYIGEAPFQFCGGKIVTLEFHRRKGHAALCFRSRSNKILFYVFTDGEIIAINVQMNRPL